MYHQHAFFSYDKYYVSCVVGTATERVQVKQFFHDSALGKTPTVRKQLMAESITYI